MYGMTRATTTLLGAGVAGLLLWLASQTDADGLGGYWTWLGLLAAAGLVMALSQLLGGWTKWGWPRLSVPVFLIGFLPALAVGGLVILAAQPESAWGSGLAADLGFDGLANDLEALLPAIAFGLGLLFGFTFDTTGPRLREVERTETAYATPTRTDRISDEPVTADRRHAYRGAEQPVGSRTHATADRDGDGVDDRYGSVPDRDADGADDRYETARNSDADGADDRYRAVNDRDGDGVDDRAETRVDRRV